MNIPNEWVEKSGEATYKTWLDAPNDLYGKALANEMGRSVLEAVLPDILEAVATELEGEAEFETLTAWATLHRAADIVRKFGGK